jgi:hypothetical protein
LVAAGLNQVDEPSQGGATGAVTDHQRRDTAEAIYGFIALEIELPALMGLPGRRQGRGGRSTAALAARDEQAATEAAEVGGKGAALRKSNLPKAGTAREFEAQLIDTPAGVLTLEAKEQVFDPRVSGSEWA